MFLSHSRSAFAALIFFSFSFFYHFNLGEGMMGDGAGKTYPPHVSLISFWGILLNTFATFPASLPSSHFRFSSKIKNSCFTFINE